MITHSDEEDFRVAPTRSSGPGCAAILKGSPLLSAMMMLSCCPMLLKS